MDSVYGPNNSNIRKDLWVEMKDLFGLTFPKNDVCVWAGDDFNVIKRISEEFGKRYFYAYVIIVSSGKRLKLLHIIPYALQYLIVLTASFV